MKVEGNQQLPIMLRDYLYTKHVSLGSGYMDRLHHESITDIIVKV